MVLSRGNHVLPHQDQAIRRDLFAEKRERDLRKGMRWYETDEEYRRRANTPYLILVRDYGGSPVTAFRTHAEFNAWLVAYALETDGNKVVDSGRPMLPLRMAS